MSKVAESTVVELQIPPGSAYVAVARLAIAALARGAGLQEESVDELRIAFSEACTNALLIHEESNIHEPVTIRWIERRDRLVIEVVDRAPAPDAADSAYEFDSQGFSSRMVMSRVLLEALIDGCEFVAAPGGGTITRLMVHREGRPDSP
jgi:anti-sigma regulatory factor (Ser/Thr protein kinase)